MIYQIYSQNSTEVQPIKMISESELTEAIAPLVNKAVAGGLISDVNKAYEVAKKHLDDVEILNCGDYCLVLQDDVPQDQPKECGFDTFIFEA